MNWKITAAAIGVALLASTSLASAEGELQIYNWGNYTSPEMIKKFEDENNVKVTITDYDSNDTALAKIRQGGHGFDIVVPSQNYIPIWIQEGLLLETRPGRDGELQERRQGMGLKIPDFDPGRQYTVPWAMGTVGVVVNTDVYKGADQHLGHHLRHAGRTEGQGQRRARDDRRHRRRRALQWRHRNAPATWKS